MIEARSDIEAWKVCDGIDQRGGRDNTLIPSSKGEAKREKIRNPRDSRFGQWTTGHRESEKVAVLLDRAWGVGRRERPCGVSKWKVNWQERGEGSGPKAWRRPKKPARREAKLPLEKLSPNANPGRPRRENGAARQTKRKTKGSWWWVSTGGVNLYHVAGTKVEYGASVGGPKKGDPYVSRY